MIMPIGPMLRVRGLVRDNSVVTFSATAVQCIISPGDSDVQTAFCSTRTSRFISIFALSFAASRHDAQHEQRAAAAVVQLLQALHHSLHARALRPRTSTGASWWTGGGCPIQIRPVPVVPLSHPSLRTPPCSPCFCTPSGRRRSAGSSCECERDAARAGRFALRFPRFARS